MGGARPRGAVGSADEGGRRDRRACRRARSPLSREQGKPLNGPNARFELGACSVWLRTAASTVLEPEVLVDDESGTRRARLQGDRCRGRDRPVELAPHDRHLADRPVAADGQHGRGQAERVHALSVLTLIDVMNEVLPPDVLIGIAGDREVGARLASHPDVDKVMFTGSTATGRKIIESSAGNLARLTLELGGNDAGIVLPGTDPQAIARESLLGRVHQHGPDLRRPQAPVRPRLDLRRGRRRARRGGGEDADGQRTRRAERARAAAEQQAVRHRQSARRGREGSGGRDRHRRVARDGARRELLPGRRSSPTSRTASPSSTRSSSVRRCR